MKNIASKILIINNLDAIWFKSKLPFTKIFSKNFSHIFGIINATMMDSFQLKTLIFQRHLRRAEAGDVFVGRAQGFDP